MASSENAQALAAIEVSQRITVVAQRTDDIRCGPTADSPCAVLSRVDELAIDVAAEL